MQRAEAQTIGDLIDIWIEQCPDNFDTADLAADKAPERLNMKAAMRLALGHIIETYDFTFDDMKDSSPQVIYGRSADVWWVHVVPTSPVDTFSVSLSAQTGEIVTTYYGPAVG